MAVRPVPGSPAPAAEKAVIKMGTGAPEGSPWHEILKSMGDQWRRSSGGAVDLWKAAGFRPVPLAATDILPGLQTGLINAFDTTPLAALTNQWFGLAPHLLDIKWAPLVGATIMTRKSWDSLPQGSREGVRQAAEAAGDRLKGEIRATSDKAIEAMAKRGLTVHPVGPDLQVEWQKAAEAIYPKIRGSLVPADMFDEVKRLRDEFRKSSTA